MSILVVVEGKRDLGWEPLQSLPGCLLPGPLPVEPVLVLGQPGQKASFPGRGCRQKKKKIIPEPTFSENVPEAMSAFRVWLEPEPRAHVSAGRQQALPRI